MTTPDNQVRGVARVAPAGRASVRATARVAAPTQPHSNEAISPTNGAMNGYSPLPGPPPPTRNGFSGDPRRGVIPPGGQGRNSLKQRRRRKIILIGLVAVLLLVVGGLGAGYAALQIPLPNPSVMKQTSHVYYSDGTSELARLSVENREEVKLKDVPMHVQQAAVAAEDRTFWKNDGISVRGIIRAAWSNVTGNETQGGSTITQQFVKNAFLTQERTFSRKMKEVVLAVKMDREYSKDQIMELYLNTIYLGRGAYGIQAASKAYFNKPVQDMTPEEAALLAGIIRSPSEYEPLTNAAGAKERWKYVLSGMRKEGWYKQDADSAQFPQVIPQEEASGNAGLTGSTGTIMTRIQDELIANGISEQELRTGGLRITTTIDPAMQKAMDEAVAESMAGQPENLATALVAVEPGTGKVKAYYGGGGGFGSWDYAGPASPHAPGSSFKAYVLATALENGISVKSVWNGKSPQSFPDRTQPVQNSENYNACQSCTLDRATVLSLNTAYYAVTMEVGAKNVAELAQRAGITELDNKPIDKMKSEVSNNLALGQYSVSVLDHAAGLATFAANGMFTKPHLVEKVTQGDETLYTAQQSTSRAFSAEVAADATYVMENVVKAGKGLAGGRRAAGKTGTHQFLDTGENSNAWMVGYTPQLSTAVWVGNKEKEGPIRDGGGSRIYGSMLPSALWRSFMNKALDGQAKRTFSTPQFIGNDDTGNTTPSATPALPTIPVLPSSDPATPPRYPRPTKQPPFPTIDPSYPGPYEPNQLRSAPLDGP